MYPISVFIEHPKQGRIGLLALMASNPEEIISILPTEWPRRELRSQSGPYGNTPEVFQEGDAVVVMVPISAVRDGELDEFEGPTQNIAKRIAKAHSAWRRQA